MASLEQASLLVLLDGGDPVFGSKIALALPKRLFKTNKLS